MEQFLDPYQKSLASIAFGVRAMFSALGVERCALAMGCDRQTAYAYQADQVIPTRRLLALLGFVRDSANPAALEASHNLVGVIAQAAGVKVIDAQVIEHMNRGMDALNNGGRLKTYHAELCPECRAELFSERTASGVIIQRCRRCFGAGAFKG